MKIIINGLTKRYPVRGGYITALGGIDLAFAEGELVAIVGESGSGKTTLLNQLCGMDKPDSGAIYFDEKEVTRLPSDKMAELRRSAVGVVYQFYNLIPELCVRDNITLPTELDRRQIDEAYLSEIIETVGLRGREYDFPSALSGGQQQRVAIARALFQRPSLILADEPTGNLDEKNGAEVLELLCKLNEEHKITVIVVTHSAAVAERARRVVTVHNGMVVSDVRR